MHDFEMDPKGTTAFASISNLVVATIWLNDRRFSKPTVRQGERSRLVAKLRKELLAIRTPEGKRVIKSVIDGRSYYKGTKLFIAPDLLVEAEKGYTLDIFNHSAATDFMPPELAKSGDHTREGVFGISGNAFSRSAFRGREMHVHDIAPAVLRFFGLRSPIHKVRR